MAQPAQIARLIDYIREILRRHPQGLGEYELLCALREANAPLMEQADAHDTLQLFRQHFVLMHCLYRLQAIFEAQEQLTLEIGPLKIALHPIAATTRRGQMLAAPDPAKAYYLDLNRLEATGEHEVKALLDDFWSRYLGLQQRQEALRELGLDEPADAQAIKRRYRQLAMQHHPDRGGDTARLQRLHEAMRVLQMAGAV